MVIYKLQFGDLQYIGSTTQLMRKRLAEHRYRLNDPIAHRTSCRSKLYTTLRELGITTITKDECSILDEDSSKETEQYYISQVPEEHRLNSYNAIKLYL